MDEQTKKEFISLFVQGFQEVMIPALDDLEKEINQRFEQMEHRFEQMEYRFDVIETRLDVVERKLDRSLDEPIDHENRLKKLESRRALV